MTQPTLSEAPPQEAVYAQPDVPEEIPETQPEIADIDPAPETDAEQQPDLSLGEAPADAEAPAESEPDDDPLKDPRYQKLLEGELAKKEESFRRTREAERKQAEEAASVQYFQQQRQEAMQWRHERAGQTVWQMANHVAKEVADGKEVGEVVQATWQQFVWMAQDVDRAAMASALAPLETALPQILATEFPGYTPAAEKTRALWTAYARQDTPGILQAFTAIAREAAIKTSEPDLRKQWQKDLEAEQKTTKLREAEAQRKAQSRPTSANGAPPAQDMDAMRVRLNDPETSPAERKKLYKAVYGFEAP